jgi:hypothetical protein
VALGALCTETAGNLRGKTRQLSTPTASRLLLASVLLMLKLNCSSVLEGAGSSSSYISCLLLG